MGIKLGLLGQGFGDAAEEQAFRVHYVQSSFPFVPRALVLGALLYGLFGVLDSEVARASRDTFWLIRYALVCPALFIAAGLLQRPSWRHLMEPVVALCVALAGLGIVAMVVVSHPPESYLYYAGLMLVIMFGSTVSRLRFASSTLASLAIALGYELAAWIGEPVPTAIFVSNNFFFISACVLGMFASHAAEQRERRSFRHQKTIERDKASLARLNYSLAEMSLRDPLTGLLNRRCLNERLDEAAAVFRRHHLSTGVVIIDIDDFKMVNDRFGHGVGDTLLVDVSRTLEASVRETDLVFRLGGDEFCLLLFDADQATAVRVAEDALAALRQLRVREAPQARGIGFSAGCAVIDGTTDKPENLLRDADRLMYKAKSCGKNRLVAS